MPTPPQLGLLRDAIKAVPAVKYALGIAGIISVIALVASWGVDFRIAVFGAIVMVILMVILLIFARLTTAAKGHFVLPALVLVWSSLIITVAAAAFLGTSVFFAWPVSLRHWLAPGSSIREGPAQNGQQYRLISAELRRDVQRKLAAFRQKYGAAPPRVRIEYESGNDERFKIGATLGEILSEQSLGGFDATSTFSGRFPGYPITLHCGSNGLEVASTFLSAISTYLTGQVNVVTVPPWPATEIRLYLNGTPSFSQNGSVILQ